MKCQLLEFIKTAQYTEPELDRVNLPWGYKTNNSAEYVYIKDYQGNIRAVTDSKGSVIQSTDYYPYGMPMATSTGAEVNRYKYSGKELETNRGLNFYDFDARMCDVGAPLFNRMDDYGYTYPWYNPYLYCGGDPVNCIDPDGKRLFYMDDNNNKYEFKQNEKGEYCFYDSNGNITDLSTFSIDEQTLQSSLIFLSQLETGREILSELIYSETSVIINIRITKPNKSELADNLFNPNTGNIEWNPRNMDGGIYYDNTNSIYNRYRDPAIGLAHEMSHALEWVKCGFINNTPYNNKLPYTEVYACNLENAVRVNANAYIREFYGDIKVRDALIPDYETAIPYVSKQYIYLLYSLMKKNTIPWPN